MLISPISAAGRLNTYRPSTLFPEPLPPAPSRELAARVAAWHHLTAKEIFGPSRRPGIVAARHDAMAAVRMANPALSLPMIGRVFKRDHTTVMHALQKLGVPTVLARRT